VATGGNTLGSLVSSFGAYVRGPDGIRHGTSLFVLTLAGDRICALTRFESSVLAWFGLLSVKRRWRTTWGSAAVTAARV